MCYLLLLSIVGNEYNAEYDNIGEWNDIRSKKGQTKSVKEE